jgi:hypothetical protein
MSIPKLQRTKNYSQFFYTKENRDVDILHLKPQHKALRESMQQYGFLPAFPLMVRTQNGRFAVVDGQHRLTFAKELGLEVFFVIDDKDVNISAVNQAQANWSPKDYANRWAHAGRPDYVEAIAFANEHNAPLVHCLCNARRDNNQRQHYVASQGWIVPNKGQGIGPPRHVNLPRSDGSKQQSEGRPPD